MHIKSVHCACQAYTMLCVHRLSIKLEEKKVSETRCISQLLGKTLVFHECCRRSQRMVRGIELAGPQREASPSQPTRLGHKHPRLPPASRVRQERPLVALPPQAFEEASRTTQKAQTWRRFSPGHLWPTGERGW